MCPRAFGSAWVVFLLGLMSCPQETSTCASSEACGAQELCVEGVCLRLCETEDECGRAEICHLGFCRSFPRPDAAVVDRVQPDVGGDDRTVALDRVAPDRIGQDRFAAPDQMTAPDRVTAPDRTPADAGETDAGPADPALLYPEHFEYLGAFRLPRGGGDSSFGYGGESITFRPDGDPGGAADGFTGSLFVQGHTYDDMFAEISIPVPVVSPEKNVEVLDVAAFL